MSDYWIRMILLVHCVKSVQIRSFFWSVLSCTRTRKNSVFGHFSRSAFKNFMLLCLHLASKKYFLILKSFVVFCNSYRIMPTKNKLLIIIIFSNTFLIRDWITLEVQISFFFLVFTSFVARKILNIEKHFENYLHQR